MREKRAKILKKAKFSDGNTAYWMSRDQRANDNRALIHAVQLAIERKKPLYVFFNLVPEFLGATLRQYDFMIGGLKKLETGLRKKNIPFVLATGQPGENIPELIRMFNIDQLVTDFDPLKIKQHWLNQVMERTDITITEVDAHNIVPCRETSDKQEYGAYTIRPKIRAKLYDYLDKFPRVEKHPYLPEQEIPLTDWDKVRKSLKVDCSVEPITWLKPGEDEAAKVLRYFIDNKLNIFAGDRNDPTKDALSNLSAYLHFGQICSQRAVMEVMASSANDDSKDAFIEEIVVRKELADNFCFYNKNYDNTDSFKDWAKATLNKHRNDLREYLYSCEELELARTHDDLWNASQLQMVKTGKMHGYMRMYWAKKILEWTESPEQAMEFAVYLNDKYEIDGRDPNGYTGIAWSIGGVHDRAWKERPIFGKIRYMSYNGARSKFDIKKYIDKYVK